mmetsp:Transcript_26961/g.50332  ORF Transcript_26961/g.50332 Transcript_26961/m.50332 type:complete len:192 (-) Transcript_26961:267-842(-)|eukprot:CAMPEP_0170168802 /NCGR_PEP_ID=MMETSP0040_2-20121228/1757_1 /TAXON_ID=641309 /ORGANISM="Lotharella oceanica, Strain CCMP622" /LENGTH=191 /DNA_ID=CAMNT_0010407179 /DNA_START=124 /DNA_END=699 /DNA_ORIENTATION=-
MSEAPPVSLPPPKEEQKGEMAINQPKENPDPVITIQLPKQLPYDELKCMTACCCVHLGCEMGRYLTFIKSMECCICTSGAFCLCFNRDKPNRAFLKSIGSFGFCDCSEDDPNAHAPCCHCISRNSCFWCCGGGFKFSFEMLQKCHVLAKFLCLDCRVGVCGCDPAIPATIACCGMFCYGKPEAPEADAQEG